MDACLGCAKPIDGEVAQAEATVIDDIEKRMRIDEIISLLPLVDDEENDDVIGALCKECKESLSKILRERIKEEEDLKKTYEEYLKKDDEEKEMNADESMRNREEKHPKTHRISVEQRVDSEEGLCADQSKSPAPDIEHEKGKCDDDDDDRRYKELKKEYERKKEELKKIREDKQKAMRANNDRMKEWNNGLNDFLMDVSEQRDADEMMVIEKEYTEYALKELDTTEPFNVDVGKGTINGYRIACADNPVEFSAALGLCAHMLYNVYKEKERANGEKKNPKYTIIPQGFKSVIRCMGTSGNFNLYVTEELTFCKESQPQQPEEEPTRNRSFFQNLIPGFLGYKSASKEQPEPEPRQKEPQSVVLSVDQRDFEDGIEILNKEYFTKYCIRDMNLKPSKLTKEKWEHNMKQFLEAIYEEWKKLSFEKTKGSKAKSK